MNDYLAAQDLYNPVAASKKCNVTWNQYFGQISFLSSKSAY